MSLREESMDTIRAEHPVDGSDSESLSTFPETRDTNTCFDISRDEPHGPEMRVVDATSLSGACYL